MKLSTISSITRTDIHVLGKIPKVFRKNDQKNMQTIRYNKSEKSVCGADCKENRNIKIIYKEKRCKYVYTTKF